jgi:hypothetical protein
MHFRESGGTAERKSPAVDLDQVMPQVVQRVIPIAGGCSMSGDH